MFALYCHDADSRFAKEWISTILILLWRWRYNRSHLIIAFTPLSIQLHRHDQSQFRTIFKILLSSFRILPHIIWQELSALSNVETHGLLMPPVFHREVLFFLGCRYFGTWETGDTSAEPFVFWLGIVVAGLEPENTTDTRDPTK